MQKKTILWTAVATTAAAIAVYYMRRKKSTAANNTPGRRKSKHLVKAFTRAKKYPDGEFVL
jgi:hypothetical protein